MTPVAVIERLLHVNRPLAVVLLSGLGLAAAAVIANAWMKDVPTALTIGAYVAGAGALATLVAQILTDAGLLGRVIRWSFALVTIGFVAAFFVSAVFPNRTAIAPVECLARFWQNCDAARDGVADRNAPDVNVQEVASTPSAPPPPDFGAYRTFVQFAGYRRETVIEMARALSGAGWRVEGGERGGERIGAAAGKSEVRYRGGEEEAAAKALAGAIEATGVKSSVAARRNGDIRPGVLEVWIGL